LFFSLTVALKLNKDICFSSCSQAAVAEIVCWQFDLARPLKINSIQETKYNQTDGKNVRYKRGFKKELVEGLVDLVKEEIPYCKIRYAF
jgi:hypothetical protein